MNQERKSEILLGLGEFFGKSGDLKLIYGEFTFNYLFSQTDGKRYLLKIGKEETEEEIDFQNRIIRTLHKKDIQLDIPNIVQTIDRNDYQKVGNDIWRLYTWVEGDLISSCNPITDTLLKTWGETMGKVTSALAGFDDRVAHRFFNWKPSETLFSRQYLPFIKTKSKQELAKHFWCYFEGTVKSKLDTLPESVCHLDGNDNNIIVNIKKGEVTGLIDFGDAVYTHRISELAVAAAYAGMNSFNPLRRIFKLIEGYNSQFSVLEEELEVLYGLITARLLITVATAAKNSTDRPDNKYLQVSADPAWTLLEQLKSIHPDYALFVFRAACGMEPCPKRKVFNQWIETGPKFSPVMDLEHKNLVPLDLSVGSRDLGNNQNFEDLALFERKVNDLLWSTNGNIGYGGYCEIRPFYTTDAYQKMLDNGPKWRSQHIGLDLWTTVHADVFAPLDGVVHCIHNNEGKDNYGPTIILLHDLGEFSFFTLYGHLSMDCLESLRIGDTIRSGQKIAELGAAHENGGWPPHLHFQIILDMMEFENDFPGVAYPAEIKVWSSLCPDPVHFLKKYIPKNIQKGDVSTDQILTSRKEHLGSNLSVSYDSPLQIVRGNRQYLYDISGRRYLDMVNNVAHVGHEHPVVVLAGKRQMELLNTNTRYLNEQIVNYAQELLGTFPDPLDVCFFVNSGSEANELALRIANAQNQGTETIAIEVGYHGNTQACIDVSSYKFDGKGGGGKPKNTHLVPMPDIYRGKFSGESAGQLYANEVQSIIQQLISGNKKISSFIAEPILSCGGQVELPLEFLKQVYLAIRKEGGICISDEVQLGFGRVGTHFWGFQMYDVVPDIITLGKPIGNGHPLGAVVTTRAIADRFANGMEYFNTFGGNPVSCAIGRSVLNTITEEKLQENAHIVGSYLKEELIKLQEDFLIIGDVRGRGLFLGYELVKDRITKEPAAVEAHYLVNRLRDHGILNSTDGPLHNVIKLKPPMCFTKENVDFYILILSKILKEDKATV